MNRVIKSHVLGVQGRFIGVEALKLDGDYRRFNGKVVAQRYIPGKGNLLTIKEAATGHFRSFYADRVEQVNADRVRIELI